MLRVIRSRARRKYFIHTNHGSLLKGKSGRLAIASYVFRHLPIHRPHRPLIHNRWLGRFASFGKFGLALLPDSPGKLLNPAEYEFLDLKDREPKNSGEERILDQGSKCDYFHLASHGIPISNFTDPFFASIRSKDMTSEPLALPTIQKHFWAYQYSLAVFNACHSSVTTSHNYQQQFRTNELINFATLLLLNTRSKVIAAQWTHL